VTGIRWKVTAAGVVLAAAVITMAGCSGARPPASAKRATAQARYLLTPTPAAPSRLPGVVVTTPPTGATGRLPGATGGARALWQGAPWGGVTFDGGTLLGIDGAQVDAISAATGAPAWTATMPAPLTQVLGLVPAGGAVIVEAGHSTGQPPAAVFAVVTEYVALSLATGRVLWAVPVGGTYQNPPVAASGRYLLTGDTSGAVIARVIATGAVAWRDPRPAVCRQPASAGTDNAGLGLGADGPVVAASFDCGPRVVVQRLDPATGRALWTWQSPAVAAGAVQQLAVIAAASRGGIVLLAGEIAAPPAAREFTARLPRHYGWPRALDPPDQVSTVLAVSAADGRPRWTELGGQLETFTLTDGLVCEVVSPGLECRADATGAATMPTLLTGMQDGDSPPYADDALAGISGDFAAVTVPSAASGTVTLRVVRLRDGATVARVRVAIGSTSRGGSDYQVFAVAAGPLPGGAIEVLLRRVDLPGYPLLALEVPLSAAGSGGVLLHQRADLRKRRLHVLGSAAAHRVVGLHDDRPVRIAGALVGNRQQRLARLVLALGQVVAERSAARGVEVRPVRLKHFRHARQQRLDHVVNVVGGKGPHCLVSELDRCS
jgi:outer membrane protein assembly factor BamB